MEEDYYNHSYASEDKSGYSLLRCGDFSYNKSYSGDYPYGAIKRLEAFDIGIVSPLYICFESKPDTVSDYYLHYFEAGVFNHEIYKIAQEGARNHGLLNVAIEEFFSAFLLSPPCKEQQKIAEILNHCDKVIALKQQLIEEERKRKKWLIQNLLDPDSGIRLLGQNCKWEKLTLALSSKEKGMYGLNSPACLFSPELPRYIRITDIDDDGNFIKDNDVCVDHPDSADYLLSEGDLLFVRTGATVGKSYKYSKEDGELVYAGFLIKFSIDTSRCNSYLVYAACNTQTYWSWVNAVSARSGQPGINAEEYGSYEFMLPSTLEDQSIIANVLKRKQNSQGSKVFKVFKEIPGTPEP